MKGHDMGCREGGRGCRFVQHTTLVYQYGVGGFILAFNQNGRCILRRSGRGRSTIEVNPEFSEARSVPHPLRLALANIKMHPGE